MGRTRHKLAWAAALLVAIVAAALAWYFVPVRQVIDAVQGWLGAMGPWGVVLFSALFVICIVALVPGSALSVTAGLTYGMWAAPIAVIGATVGAAIAYLIAKHLVRDTVDAWIGRSRHLRAVEDAVNEEGWHVVALVRLSPLLPFNLQNYLFGITHIRFWPYVAATFFGILPGTVFDVYLGSIGSRPLDERSPLEWVVLGTGLVATAVLVWLVARKAKQRLAAEVEVEVNADAPGTPPAAPSPPATRDR
jgi:uncharacterized membrane protein YdjX (TVP38/TMEM64 family)